MLTFILLVYLASCLACLGQNDRICFKPALFCSLSWDLWVCKDSFSIWLLVSFNNSRGFFCLFAAAILSVAKKICELWQNATTTQMSTAKSVSVLCYHEVYTLSRFWSLMTPTANARNWSDKAEVCTVDMQIYQTGKGLYGNDTREEQRMNTLVQEKSPGQIF